MIEKCCICGTCAERLFELPYYDLIGSDKRNYTQREAICPRCGYIFTQNPFTEQQLESRYKNLSKFEYDDSVYDYVINDSYQGQCIRQKNFIDEAIGEDGYDSVLEVGAASGYNLFVYKKAGKKVYGIEPSLMNCNLAKKNYDIDMFNGMFQEYWEQDTHERFDVIFLSMVLEHIVNPYNFIVKCADLTDKYCFVEIPTLDYKIAEEPYGMFCEEHVSMFTRESLTNLMKKAGFSPISEELFFNEKANLPAGYPALVCLYKKDRISDNTFSPMIKSKQLFEQYLYQNEKLMNSVRRKIDNIPDNTNIALWGSGHHISMLLANTSLLRKKIVAVYDSDKRKAGMCIADVPIRPFDIDDIETLGIEKVVITTYTAQKAIGNYIESQGWNLDHFVFLYSTF